MQSVTFFVNFAVHIIINTIKASIPFLKYFYTYIKHNQL